jgi:flavoprotein
LILRGITQWLKVATDMQEKRVNGVLQREAERAIKIYRLVARIAYHWRRITINHRANKPFKGNLMNIFAYNPKWNQLQDSQK